MHIVAKAAARDSHRGVRGHLRRERIRVEIAIIRHLVCSIWLVALGEVYRKGGDIEDGGIEILSFHNLNGVLSVVVAPHIAHKADELRFLISWREEGSNGQLTWDGGLLIQERLGE